MEHRWAIDDTGMHCEVCGVEPDPTVPNCEAPAERSKTKPPLGGECRCSFEDIMGPRGHRKDCRRNDSQ